MKAVKKLIVLLFVIFPLFASCADLGAGEIEEDYMDYFSSVILMSPDGKITEKISTFYEAMALGESSSMKDVVDYDDYRLIAFEVANGYTLTVGEFAFFLHTEERSASLDFDFYITDKLPSRVGRNEETTPPEETAPDGSNPPELSEEDVFGALESYHNASFFIEAEWDSVHLEFEEPQTVSAGDYIVVRIVNNTCTCGEEMAEPSVPFTFNYLLFYISEVEKN